jgi:hypothetical protein
MGITAVLAFRFGPWSKHPHLKAVPPVVAPQVAAPAESLDYSMAGAERQTLAPSDSSLVSTAAPSGSTPLIPSAAATSVPRPAPTPLPVRVAAPISAAMPPAQARTSAVAPTAAAAKPPASAPTSVNPVAATPTSGTSSAPVTSPPTTPTQLFGIAVGTYLDQSRAQAELTRLSGNTGLTGKLVDVRKDGVTMYAVVLGAFPGRGAAERKASDLVAAGFVDEARIVPRGMAPRP